MLNDNISWSSFGRQTGFTFTDHFSGRDSFRRAVFVIVNQRLIISFEIPTLKFELEQTLTNIVIKLLEPLMNKNATDTDHFLGPLCLGTVKLSSQNKP
jgi:hypothetical protein